MVHAKIVRVNNEQSRRGWVAETLLHGLGLALGERNSGSEKDESDDSAHNVLLEHQKTAAPEGA
jgi:hypothetical protein